MSASNAEESEYVLISDQQNLEHNPHPNITILFYGNAVHIRIYNLFLTPESVKNKVNCMFTCFVIFLYKMWVLHKVRYSKVSHRISICQMLVTLEINALGPHTSSVGPMVDRLSVARFMDW